MKYGLVEGFGLGLSMLLACEMNERFGTKGTRY